MKMPEPLMLMVVGKPESAVFSEEHLKQYGRDLLEAAAVECERLFDLRDCDLARLHAAKCAAAILKMKETL
jgi:hypothetical protein